MPSSRQITRKEWDDHFWQRFRALRHQFPMMELEKVRKRAYAATEVAHGPRPPSWKEILLRLGWQLVKSGGNMDFSWMKNLWKGLRAGLWGAFAVAVTAFINALLNQVDTAEELAALGVMAWAIPLILAAGASLRNYLKQKTGLNV
jgi:hypothetical protein